MVIMRECWRVASRWEADLPPVLLTAFENRLDESIDALKQLIRHPA